MDLYSLLKATHKTNNIIYNSPHSGELFPVDFTDTIRIDPYILLLSGDSFVDQLYFDVVGNGSYLLANLYSRSFIDTNRNAYELDENMFTGDITEPLKFTNKVKLGYGSIAKYAYNREEIYKNKMPFEMAIDRINSYYFPVHNTLQTLLEQDFDHYGYSLLIDCHSMPSYGFLGRVNEHIPQADIILGDLHGKSCSEKITNFLTQYFTDHGLQVEHNAPFAGGYNTEHYSDPDNNKHTIQIEIKKSLYMDENNRIPNKNFNKLKNILTELSRQLNAEIEKLV